MQKILAILKVAKLANILVSFTWYCWLFLRVKNRWFVLLIVFWYLFFWFAINDFRL